MNNTEQFVIDTFKKLFPLATKENQLLKLDEEVAEFLENPCEEEAADIAIVCLGLHALESKIGSYTYRCLQHHYGERLYDIMRQKTEKNLKRKWEYKNGTYHHV